MALSCGRSSGAAATPLIIIVSAMCAPYVTENTSRLRRLKVGRGEK